MEERWETRIHTLDVGQGDSSLVQIRKMRENPEGVEEFLQGKEDNHYYSFIDDKLMDSDWEYNILIDGGEEEHEEKILESINKNIKFWLNAIIITHADSDHYGGIYDMLVKNNFWHLCKVILFTVGRDVMDILNGWAYQNVDGVIKERIKRTTEEIFEAFLEFSSNDTANFFYNGFITGIYKRVFEFEQTAKSWEEFLSMVEQFFNDSKDNMDAVQYLYQELMRDARIRCYLGMSLDAQSYEEHTRLATDMIVFMSLSAGRELFPTESGQKLRPTELGWELFPQKSQAGIYKGSWIAEGIKIERESKLFKKYGVDRKIRILTFKHIGMDLLKSISDKLEPEIVPVKMVLAAADQYADPFKWYQIKGDGNVKNCSSIAILFQMGGFLYYSGGDLPKDGENAITERISSGIYNIAIAEGFEYYMGFKVGHHGSTTATSEVFLDKFKPGYGVISCGDHAGANERRFQFPAKETVLGLIRQEHIQNVFTTAYPNVDPDELREVEASGKVVVTGFFSNEPEERQYNRRGDMVCDVQADGREEVKKCFIQMETYEGEAAECIWRTYPLFQQGVAVQNALAVNSRSAEKTAFVLIPGVLEFEDIRPLEGGIDGFTAEFMLGGKRLAARFADLRKWKCYEGTLSVADHQVLGLGDLLQWAGKLFPNLQIFSEQEQWNLDQAGIESIYLYWNAWAERIVKMKWHGRVTIGMFTFFITFTMPEYEMELELLPNQQLTIGDCLKKAGLPKEALGFFGGIGLDGLTLRVSPADGRCYMELRLGTEERQESGITFEKLVLQFGFRKDQGVQAGMKGILCIGGMAVKFLALYEDGDWTLSGRVEDQEGISLGAVLTDIAKEAGAEGVTALPADFQLIYAAVDIVSVRERNWALRCGGRLTVLGTELGMGLAVRVQTTGKERALSVVGTVTLLEVDFTCVFEKVRQQSAELFYIRKEDGLTLDLQELVRLFDANVTLPVDVKLMMREVAVLHLPSGGMIFQAVLGGELELSLRKLPVIGGFLPERADFKLDGIKIGYVQLNGGGEEKAEALAEAGRILTGNGLSDLPKQLAGGFFMEITADVGGDKISYLLGGKAQEKPSVTAGKMLLQEAGEEGLPVQGTEAEGTTVGKSFAVNKKLGPLELHRITIKMSDGKLWFTPDVTVSMGCFLVDFTDVSMGISLAEHTVSARVDGMGLSYQQAGLSLAAAFRRADDETMLYRYDGILSVQASKWQLMGMGSYGKLKDSTVSFYLFLDASMRIVVQPSLVLTGIMAGAGINKALRVPEIEEVEKFPLLAGGSRPSAVLDDLNRNWLVSQAGRDWLAVGVRFRVAELVDGKALLMANLGGELEFALLGLCELELPKNSAKPYLHITLQLRADLKPASGIFSVEIAVGKSSYLLCPDCHITGGAALYTWFAPSGHRGDFVLTIGGYHPAFAVPAHYPKVDRVGIAWQVSREVSLKGEAYFAITPSCAMAGANLSITYENGNLKAWFMAWANLLVAWKPFHFLADIGVNLGVSYRLNLLFCHKTLTVSIGGSLRLWGPPTGGKVTVHLWFISFTVGFGADEDGADSNRPLSWREFQELLPQGDTLQIHPAAGLESRPDDGIWLVRGKDFRFTVESAVPASSITAGQNVHRAQGGTIHIRPMNLTEADTGMKVNIVHRSTKSSAENDFAMEEKRQRVAESLWGAPLYRDGKFVQSDSAPTASLLDDRLTGAEFVPRKAGQGTEIVIADLDALGVLRNAGSGTAAALRLVDYRLPVLKAGLYDITVAQGVQKAGQVQETFPQKTQSFYVGGCRFAWNKGTVVNTYPPRGSAGSFANALPHVVLADSTLPWERQYGTGAETPWLALFLLRRDEIEPGENGDGTCSMSIDEFCGRAAGAARPVLEKEPGVDGASLCSVLTLPASLYRAILPSERELCLLCHGRNTALSDRAEDFGSSADEDGFSVVMANRMPGVGEYTGYLVSLEGTETLRTVTEGNVQLLCMDSFTFRSTEEAAEDFYHFAVTLLQNNRGNTNLGSGMGDGSEDGYCQVAYRAGNGAEEQRRFRGILKPVNAEDTREELPLKTAFSMGRMLALGQSDFIAGMLRYREQRSMIVSRMMRLRGAGDRQWPERTGLDENKDVLQAVRGVDDSIMNLLRPVPKDKLMARNAAIRKEAAENGGARQKPEAVYGVRRYTAEKQYELRRSRRQADEVCLCLEKGRSLSASSAGEPDQAPDRWLEDLLLLKGLPFSCLLPSERLLPPESVRFFQVDKAWLSALAAGAAGIGENCRKQAGITQDLLRMWEQRIEQEERYGILLRTHMLRLWQNMAVYACDEGGKEVTPLRMERLSEDILLILCDVPLTSLKIREPSEGIRMQFNEDGTIHPRNPKTMETGGAALACGERWKWFRDDSRRILNVAGERGLADMFAEHFGKADLPNGQLTPAGFALQFIEGTRSVAVTHT